MHINNSANTFLGVDLGGTKLLVGEVNVKGELLRHEKYLTGKLSQQEAVKLIENSIQAYLNAPQSSVNAKPTAIGLGLVGRVDAANGIWFEIDPTRTTQIDIVRYLSRKFKLPCFADNDVRSAAKAEMLFGCGRKSSNLVYINIGTGIAAGVVTKGHLICGGHFNAGEVGHTTSGIAQVAPCVCGRSSCIETIASGSGFDKCARLLSAQFKSTALTIPKNGESVSVKEVFELYGKDELCTLLTDNAAQGLANLIMNLVRVTDPDTVVLGGGVVSDGFLYPKIVDKIERYTIRFVTNGVLLTKLNPAYVGLMGACSNAINGMEETSKAQRGKLK